MGFSLSRMADRRARDAGSGAPAVEPLAPGEDPLAALDPETRELVTSLEPAVDDDADDDGTTFGDRVGGALIGAGLGAVFGAVLGNRTMRLCTSRHSPMDVGMTLMTAAAGAAILGISGFAKGGNPLGRDTQDPAEHLARSMPDMPAQPSHPAFAGVVSRSPR